ncbi:MAG: bifunctional adenosylcobinamide kinase/adenosylcobinamide-phosphate guanylyltransferase [Candidatus Aadella gelida]|nr:bifunctional adenosylcobinamide kinase/adenosylcobinamide-phosphate guanylyltransferase [Candidatus Aadella gelida]
MSKIILVLGGARSGKSSYAVECAKKFRKKTAFIATAEATDEEMKRRIKLHKLSRPRQWKLIEEGKEISSVLSGLKDKYGVILIDCVGLLISNLMAEGLKDRDIEKKIKEFITSMRRSASTLILVSNDVGSGVVPEDSLARRFRDVIGFSNQMIAKKADEVILMQAGIPLYIKGREKICKN